MKIWNWEHFEGTILSTDILFISFHQIPMQEWTFTMIGPRSWPWRKISFDGSRSSSQFLSHLLDLSLTTEQPRLKWIRRAEKARTLWSEHLRLYKIMLRNKHLVNCKDQDLDIVGPWKRLTQCCWTGGRQELVTIRKQSQWICTIVWLNCWEVYTSNYAKTFW